MTASKVFCSPFLRGPWLAAALALAGCASGPAGPAPSPGTSPPPAAASPQAPARYRCEQGLEFTARFGDGTALIDAGPRGVDTLLRDAGGVTPRQTVYSSTRLRAEFGLGEDGKQAVLHYVAPPLEVRCIQQ